MNDWDFQDLREKLHEAVKMVWKQEKIKCVETYVDCYGKEYKVIIEEVVEDEKEY